MKWKDHLLLAAAFSGAALFACAQGERSAQSADATARNLTLAPTESSAALRDVPEKRAARKPAARAARAARAAPAAPAAPHAAPTTFTLPAGTRLALAASDSISTRTAKPGDAFTATVGQDVRDASGQVVIPAGSRVEGTITAADPAPNPNSSGKLELAVKTVTVRGRSYPVEATVVSKDTVMKGRGVTGADAARVGAGAAAGAIVGKLLGKDGKGAVIGGAVGAATGAGVSRAVRDIDVVIPRGAAITITLDRALTVRP
jgi:outer membrane protein with glycine zipper